MVNMSTDIIKKCPFCGGEAEFHRTPVKSNGGWCDGVVVRCKVCEARTNMVLYDAKKHPNDEEYDEALKAWNTRKPLERVIERLEECSKEHFNYWDEFDDEYSFGAMNAYMNSIAIIIKQEMM